MRASSLSILLLGLAAAVPAWTAPAQLSAGQRALLAPARRQTQAGWISLHLEGGPRAMGFQHGYLLAEEIRDGLAGVRLTWEHKTGLPWAELLTRAATFFLPGVDPESMEELAGMAEGLAAAGVASSREELAVYNGSTELQEYWWPQELARLRGEPFVHHVKESCSAFIAVGSYTRGGGLVMGHNTMTGFQNPQVNLVLDLVPAKGHRILMQGVPGWIHSGSDFFITDAGLVGCETTIGDFQPYAPGGIPEFVRMRRATQDAGGIDAWCKVLRTGNNGGYANAWLLGDVGTGEIARLELGLRYVGFERKRDGCFTGSNIAEDPRILRLETTSKDTDVNQSKVARRLRWRQLMEANRGRIDATLAKAFLADHQDMAKGMERPGGRSLCGHFELEPEALWDSPFEPAGSTDAKVVDAAMARRMAFEGRFGSSCGRPFDAAGFLAAHPQFAWLAPVMPSRPGQPWTTFVAAR